MPAKMKIRSAYSTLPAAERKVADFILEDPERASLMVINEIADAAGVSVPSVTRLAKKLREGAFEREVQPEYVPADDTVEAGTFEVVRRKRFPIKPMSVEEAILQMDLLEHTFFVFRDVAADGAVSVVYRRKDGGYGLISDATE